MRAPERDSAPRTILTRALTDASQEELASHTLGSALATSGAELGWVGLVNAHKRLDTLAISQTTWDACGMGEHGVRQLQNMQLRGLWATTILTGRATIVNHPAQHPEREGVPLGHPPIRNFMGIPLLVGERAIGMIALANRPGGFEDHQPATLQPLSEALAIGLQHQHTKAELNLQAAVLGALPDGIAVCDPAGVVTQVNPAFLAMWGLSGEDQVVGWPLLDTLRLEQVEAAQCIERPLRGIPWRGEATASPTDGGRFPLEVLASPILNSEGTPVAVCVTMRDVTEWKDAEDRMWATTVDLSRSNQDLEGFAHLAARELQAPLRKILAYGEFLESDCGHQLNKLGREYLGRILESSRRQQQIVDGLLRYSRIRCNEVAFTRVDIAQLTRDVVSDLRPLMRELGGSVQVDGGVSLRCDEPLVRLLLEKLMDNGLRYHRPGVAPEVRVSARCEGSWCVISVEDNGVGFDDGDLHQMFQVFGKLQGRDTHQGTGLGLTVVQRIAEQHGGTVTATSTPGRGSVFTVSLPHLHEREPFVAPALRTNTFSRDEE